MQNPPVHPFQRHIGFNRTFQSAPVVLPLRRQAGATTDESRVFDHSRNVPAMGGDATSIREQVQGIVSSTKARKLWMFVAGAVCAGGVAFMLLTSGGTSSSQTASVQPRPIESGAPTDSDKITDGNQRGDLGPDPRAVAVAAVLTGATGVGVAQMSDVSAEVVSRNGDVVLVAVRGKTAEKTETALSVLLVNEKGSWVVREIYSANSSSSKIGSGTPVP